MDFLCLNGFYATEYWMKIFHLSRLPNMKMLSTEIFFFFEWDSGLSLKLITIQLCCIEKNREIPWKKEEKDKVIIMNLLLVSMLHETLEIYHQKHKIAVSGAWDNVEVAWMLEPHTMSAVNVFFLARGTDENMKRISLSSWSLSFNDSR